MLILAMHTGARKRLTFGRKVAQGGGTVALDFNAGRVCQRNQYTAYTQIQKMRLQVIAQSKDGDSSRHL